MAITLSGENTLTSLDGVFKRVFGKKVNAIPTLTKLQGDIDFSQQDKLGDDYQMTIELQLEHGYTYAGPTDDAFALDLHVAGATQPARVRGSQGVLRTAIGYKAAFAGQGGDRAFENATKGRVRNMWLSARKRCEFDLLYGQHGAGGVGVISTLTGSVYTMETAEWAPGLWSGMAFTFFPKTLLKTPSRLVRVFSPERVMAIFASY